MRVDDVNIITACNRVQPKVNQDFRCPCFSRQLQAYSLYTALSISTLRQSGLLKDTNLFKEIVLIKTLIFLSLILCSHSSQTVEYYVKQ